MLPALLAAENLIGGKTTLCFDLYCSEVVTFLLLLLMLMLVHDVILLLVLSFHLCPQLLKMCLLRAPLPEGITPEIGKQSTSHIIKTHQAEKHLHHHHHHHDEKKAPENLPHHDSKIDDDVSRQFSCTPHAEHFSSSDASPHSLHIFP